MAGQDDRSELRASAACLVAYLDTYPASGRAFSVLRFVAQETMKRIDARLPHHINNFAIQTAVKGCADHDPSGWLSPIWKKIESDILPKREQGLQDFARGRGMTAYPWVAKTSSSGGAGNQAHYHLVTRAMPCTQAPAVTKPPDPDITYIRLETLQPSWMSRILFGKNLSLAGGRKFMFVLSPLAGLAFAIYLCWYAWYVVSSPGASPGVGNVLLALLPLFYFWVARRQFRHLTSLIEDRVVMANDGLFAIEEPGVCLELATPSTPANGARSPRVLRLVKYAALCPICSAQVLLDKGEPDFPRRIVGRCMESPREHVFSFDRATHSGDRLRGPRKNSGRT